MAAPIVGRRFKPQTGRHAAIDPDIAPGAVMIAPDFVRLRVLATESVATPMVEGAWTRRRAKDQRARGKRSL